MKPPIETGLTVFARNGVNQKKVPIDGTRTKDCMDLIPNLRIGMNELVRESDLLVGCCD